MLIAEQILPSGQLQHLLEKGLRYFALQQPLPIFRNTVASQRATEGRPVLEYKVSNRRYKPFNTSSTIRRMGRRG